MILGRIKTVFTLLLLLLSTTAVMAGDLKYGYKPGVGDANIDSNLLYYYTRWKGDTGPIKNPDGTVESDINNIIEDANAAKPLGDGYLTTYTASGTSKPIYIIKGDATGDIPDSWKSYNDSGLKIASTSEATGYGMIIFALMSDKDPKAQQYFDGLMNLYLRNLSATEVEENGVKRTLNTMSWAVPTKYTTTGGVQPARTTSATDGDMDIAFALLLADKKWGSVSTYANTTKTYLELAKLLINDIKDYLISSETNRVLMGDSYFHETDGTWDATVQDDKFNHTSTRPSDWMPAYFRMFNTVVPDAKWGKAISEIYRILPMVSGEKLDASGRLIKTSLVPDFVEDVYGSPSPGKKTVTKTAYDKNGNVINDDEGNPITYKAYMESWKDDMLGQNACRVPFRIAIDYVLYGNSDAMFYLQQLNSWSATIEPRKLRTDWTNDNWANVSTGYKMATFPENISAGYTLDGTPTLKKYDSYGNLKNNPNWSEDEPYIDNHFVAHIGFASVVENITTNTDKTWNLITNNFGGDNTALAVDPYTCYFGDSLSLMNMLLVGGYWKNPTEVNGAEKNFRNERTKKWYSKMQTAINESANNDTIVIYDQDIELVDYGVIFANISGKNGLTIKTIDGAPKSRVISRPYWGQQGIRITNSSNIVIENVHLGSLNLRVDSNCSDVTIDNVIVNSHVLLCGKDLEVKNSTFVYGSLHPNSFIVVKDVENFLFHHNIVYGGWSSYVGVSQEGNNTGVAKYYNNLFRDVKNGISVSSGSVNIRNNIFTDMKGTNNPAIKITGSGSKTINYNLYPSAEQMVSGGTAGANKVIGDPKTTLEYESATRIVSASVETGSPVIDAGISISGINDNTPDGNPDIGPIEVVNAAAAPRSWSNNTTYGAGDRVVQNGNRYISNYPNAGAQPTSAVYPYGPWEKVNTPVTVSSDNFNYGTGSWWNYNESPAVAQMYNENGVLRTDIYNGGSNRWSVQVAKNVTLEKGKYYTLSFDAKTESALTIQAVLAKGSAPYTAYSQYQQIKLTSDMAQYSFTFKMDHSTDSNAVLEFDLGGEVTPQDIWIDNVKLIKE